MVLSYDEAEKIKQHLLKQLNNFPEDKREQIKSQVESMPASKVEEFVNENELSHLGGQCIFCSIINGSVPSFRIGENSDNIAILEINPLSKGHTLVVPKHHSKEISRSTHDLANFVAKELSQKFVPNKVQIKEINIMGHPLLEVVPLYGGESERSPASEDELFAVQEIFKKKVDEPKIEPELGPEPELKEVSYKLPPRIP